MRNSKNKNSIRLASTLLAGCLLLSCTKEETGEGKDAASALQIHVGVQDFSTVAPEQTPTRTVEKYYGTFFTEGDTIGITSISNGAILKDNIPYRLNGAGAWEPATGETPKVTVPEDAATTFIAYYPYSVAMAGKKTEEEIFDAFSVATDQSTHEKYTASNLMTATGTLSDDVLHFKLSHRMALIHITQIDHNFPPVTLEEFNIDGNTVLPCNNNNIDYSDYSQDHYHYRYLMKVTATSQTVELTGRSRSEGVWQKFATNVSVSPGYSSLVVLRFVKIPGPDDKE
jgi:hypothetical protein